MSGITSGVGVFSGINREQIIGQLLAIDARPKSISQRRIVQLQGLQAAYLDVNSKISALRTAAKAFGTNNLFNAAATNSSNQDVLTAKASAGAAQGSYSFVVDRLVSTQQTLSSGFANSGTDGIGLTKLTIESSQARLDRDTDLSQLNGGAGITRGKILVTDSSGAQATIDLSRVGTVNDVITAINSATGVRVRASVDGDRFVIKDNAGGAGSITIADAPDSTTATSLGIIGTNAGGLITGSRVNTLGGQTALSSLNGGLGVAIRTEISTAATPDFRIKARSGVSFDIDIGDTYATVDGKLTKTRSAATDLAGVVQRINEQSGGAITASIDTTTNALRLVDNTVPDSGDPFVVEEINNGTTARDLGIIASTPGGTITGRRLNASLNSTLLRNLNGGQGISGDGAFNITLADGTGVNLTVNANASVSDFIRDFNSTVGSRATLSLNKSGVGFTLTDNTTGPGQLQISGAGATSLGFTAGNFSSTTLNSARSQLQYVSDSTRLDTLNGGAGIGTGQIELINSYGERSVVAIDSSVQTIADLNRRLTGNQLKARVNDKGDGILIEEVQKPSGAGGSKISIKDISGGVARSLNLVGTASGTGSSNKIDGSFERVITFAATDTLEQVSTKINEAGALASASILSDGSSARPFRLALTARSTGLAGSFVVESEGVDLGLTNTAEARNARVFFGSADPAKGVLLTSTTNTISGAIDKVSVDLKGVSSSPVTLTVTKDTAAIEKGITDFIDAFNALAESIDSRSKYDADTQKRGVLLGDSTSSSFRAQLYSLAVGAPIGVSGRYQSLSQVGVTFSNSKLSLNTDKLRQALATDPKAVSDLFAAKGATTSTTSQQPIRDLNGNIIPGAFTNTTQSGTFTSQGVLERIADLADRYTRSTDGLLTRQNKTIDEQIKSANARISAIDAGIERRRAILNKQFLRMEEAIGKLQSQQGSISNLSNLIGR